MKMSPYTIANNSSLPKCGLKSMAEAPDLAWGHLCVTGAGREGGSQKFQNIRMFPYITHNNMLELLDLDHIWLQSNITIVLCFKTLFL